MNIKPIYGTDIRNVNGQIYVFYYGKNEKAKTWANNLKIKNAILINTYKEQ